MNYQETIDYLFQQLPMFSRVGVAAYKKDLDNTISLCNWLNNPQLQFKTIHIAGTNGKGSTSHTLAAILQQAGYKTGLYTSPHLKDFRERIKINGEMVTEEFVIEFTEKTMGFCEHLKPSFFELTVAMAFDWFANQKVDIAVIETGLGGRLDSTNIISPVLSIITNIGWDHMNILGNTLAEIASEKAGIIKNNIPVIIGETSAETESVFLNKANATGSKIRFADKEYQVLDIAYSVKQLACTILNVQQQNINKFYLDLNGAYQAKNLCTVLAAVKELRLLGFAMSDNLLEKALKQVKKLTGLFGRWQVIGNEPLIVLDVAHNEDGISQVLHQLDKFYRGKTVHFVMGMVKDKELSKVLQLLPKQAKYYFTQAQIPRALPASTFKNMAAEYNLSGNDFDHINTAIAAAKKSAKPEDIIMVCGSVFLVGEVNDLVDVQEQI